ncbi:hypothetical protein [Rhodobacter viridis]|uniref:hypothetical protein n=1 Tax=Rhodobacter viridis TaxID=1054202 RepID=UPI001C64B495|nr:hypothetical protein [Rhodobacter viridis]
MRSTTDKIDGEDVSARLFDDIHALANLCANAVIPKSSSAPIALESVPDFVLSRDDARLLPLDGPIGTDLSFLAPVSAPLKGRRGEMRRAGTQTRLRIDCTFRGPSRAIISSAFSASPPMGSRLRSVRGPPQSPHEADADPNLWWGRCGLAGSV